MMRALSRADSRARMAAGRMAAKAGSKASARAKKTWEESDTRRGLDPLLGRKDADGNVIAESALARGKANLNARKAEAVAKGLGWATGAGKDAGSRNRVQDRLSKSKVARQAYENRRLGSGER
jgi:hypothetical protein